MQQAVRSLVVARITVLDRLEMLTVRKRLRRAWGLSGRRGLSRGPQASGTPGPEEQKPSPQHREDRPEEGVALPPGGLGGTVSGVPGSGPGVSGPGFPSMLESCKETAAPKDEHSQDAAPVELSQSWETAPMEAELATGRRRDHAEGLGRRHPATALLVASLPRAIMAGRCAAAE